MNIKVLRLHRLEGDGALKAYTDILVEDGLIVKGLRVVEGRKGLFVSMPREQGADSRWYELVRPVTKEVKDEIVKVVLEAYQH